MWIAPTELLSGLLFLSSQDTEIIILVEAGWGIDGEMEEEEGGVAAKKNRELLERTGFLTPPPPGHDGARRLQEGCWRNVGLGNRMDLDMCQNERNRQAVREERQVSRDGILSTQGRR